MLRVAIADPAINNIAQDPRAKQIGGGHEDQAKKRTKGDQPVWLQKAKCALESDVYQQEQYNGIGQACLDDAANGQPQPVWAVKTKIVIPVDVDLWKNSLKLDWMTPVNSRSCRDRIITL